MTIQDTKKQLRSTDPESRSARRRLVATRAYGMEAEADKAISECPYVDGERVNQLKVDGQTVDSEVIFRGFAFLYGNPWYLVSKIGPDGFPFKSKWNVPMDRLAKIERGKPS